MELKHFLIIILSLFSSITFAQGNFTIEWESPDGWHYSEFLKLDNNSEVFDLAFYDVNNPNSVRIYDGATHNLKYSYVLSEPFAVQGIQAVSYREDNIYCNKFDVTGDGINELFFWHSSTTPYYTIFNPVNGTSVYSIPIYGFSVVDIDGDNYMEIIVRYDPSDIHKIRIISTPVYSVSIENQNSIAKGFSLEQNYPNPFNPETTIEYSLEKSSDVKLIIYDLTGREVSILVNGIQNVGNHKLNFSGNGLPSGTYFYQLITNGISESKKMILIK